MTLQPRNSEPDRNLQAVQWEPEPITAVEYDAIKQYLARHKPYPYLLFIKLLRNTGMRQHEAIALTPRDILDRGLHICLAVLRGKRSRAPRRELVPVHPEVGADLQQYVRIMRVGPDTAIWPFRQRQLQYVFREASLEATGRPIGVHQIRHLYITSLLDAGAPIAAVARLVGHSDPRTTQKWYYDMDIEKRAAIARTVGT